MKADREQGTVHVIDDDEEVRWAIETLLISDGIAARTHASATAFLDALPAPQEATGIGCVLTDVRMPDIDGLELLCRLKQVGFRPPVIVMTAHGDISMTVRAMKAGALDFIEKPFEGEALLAVIRAARNVGEAPEAAATAPEADAHRKACEAVARIAALSPREREVLELAMDGKPNKLIAHELGISIRTVEVHRMRLLARLRVRSLAEAVRLAVWAELHGSAPAPRGAP